MSDDEVVVPVETPAETPIETPAEKQAREKREDEERRYNQKEFDPKIHGVGTQPVMEPESVKELFKYVLKLEARVSALEH